MEEKMKDIENMKKKINAFPGWKTDGKEELIPALKEKIKELGEKIEHFSNDEEAEGIIMSLQSSISEREREIESHCNHDVLISFEESRTEDARLEVLGKIQCRKCRKTYTQRASESLDIETIMSM